MTSRSGIHDFLTDDLDYRRDSDASTFLFPSESRAELWLAWLALLPSKRPAFLDEQDDDAREWLLHQAEITGAVDMLKVEMLARPVGAKHLSNVAQPPPPPARLERWDRKREEGTVIGTFRDTPSMKREPTQHWWEAVEYTSHDGRTVRSRSGRNAVIELYGTVVMTGAICHEKTDVGSYRAVMPVLDLKAFRRDGSLEQIGSVSWATDSDTYRRSIVR